MVASMITSFPTLCPNSREIPLYNLPSDPMVAATISEMLPASSRNDPRCLRVDSPLSEKACRVVYNPPNLRVLSVVVEKDSPLPPVVLPNLTNLDIK